MGMYTGLRCKITLKPEFTPTIDKLINREDWFEKGWHDLGFEEFAGLPRAGMIPFGVLAYMPDEWETKEAIAEWKNRLDGDKWIFQCSLKNYDQEIEKFFELVLPKITADVEHLEYFYEEQDISDFYELKDGKIVLSEKAGNRYY